jgi:hypothetical protein
MVLMLAALLLPLHFTAPADTIGAGGAGRERAMCAPVRSYLFYRLDDRGAMEKIPGYADSAGTSLLLPHSPGTRETVWLSPGAPGRGATIYALSQDRDGNVSQPSNGCMLWRTSKVEPPAPHLAGATALDVPIVRQAPERCGQAALEMVLRFYGAPPEALREVDAAYDPVLRGSLITDLAGAARRAGYEADVATLTPEALVALIGEGVPPILLYQNGSGPLTVRHFGVVTGWDAGRGAFTLHDGTPRARVTSRGALAKQWGTAGSQALIVRRRPH